MITQADFKPLLKHGKVVVIDIRSLTAYADGHIPWAKHIPMKQLTNRLNEIPTNKPIILVCGNGEKSAEAVTLIPGADWLEGGTDAYFA